MSTAEGVADVSKPTGFTGEDVFLDADPDFVATLVGAVPAGETEVAGLRELNSGPGGGTVFIIAESRAADTEAAIRRSSRLCRSSVLGQTTWPIRSASSRTPAASTTAAIVGFLILSTKLWAALFPSDFIWVAAR